MSLHCSFTLINLLVSSFSTTKNKLSVSTCCVGSVKDKVHSHIHVESHFLLKTKQNSACKMECHGQGTVGQNTHYFIQYKITQSGAQTDVYNQTLQDMRIQGVINRKGYYSHRLIILCRKNDRK